MTGCTVSGNSTTGNGGGVLLLIYQKSGTATLTDCNVIGNSAGDGGGIYSNGTLKVSSSFITYNLASGNSGGNGVGGGVFTNGGNLTLSQSLLSGNTAIGGAGDSGRPWRRWHRRRSGPGK